MHLHFVAGSGGSAFMAELLNVVADSVRRAGGQASVHEGAYPEDTHDSVYVVTPHEYFLVTPPENYPTEQQCRRTIAFCTEHRGMLEFERTARYTAALGGVVDIYSDSVEEFHHRGIPAHHFQLGYSPLWDVWGGKDRPRSIDVTYMGTSDSRRFPILSRYADELWPWRTHLLTPPHEWMTKPRGDFHMGGTKLNHLANCQVLLNVHRGVAHSLERMRVLEAMCNGCVVVSEHSVDVHPLVAGQHLLVGCADSLASLATTLLRNPDHLQKMREDAYTFCKTELDMKESATQLLNIAEELASGKHHRRLIPVPTTPDPIESFADNSARHSPEFMELRGKIDQLQEVIATMHVAERRRQQMQSQVTFLHEGDNNGKLVHPKVEAIVTRCPGDQPLLHCVRALMEQTADCAISICDDGTGEDLLPVCEIVTRWGKRLHTMMTYSTSVGRGAAREALLQRSQSEFVFVIDANHECFPPAIEQLLAALETEETAAAAYCYIARDDAKGLDNQWPFEPRRLTRTNYLGAAVLLRRSILEEVGGYCTDVSLSGMEDYDLWCRLAESGYSARHVPEMLVRYRTPTPLLEQRMIDPQWSKKLVAQRSSRLFSTTGR